jgi:hypothetical protein
MKKRQAAASVIFSEPENLPATNVDPAKALAQAIAMDIGKEVVAYVRVMYPDAIKAASSTFPLSLRNMIYNEIMAAIEVRDEGQIVTRLHARKKFRREWIAAWRKIREP